MQTYRLSKTRVQEIKNILKFKSKDKRFLAKYPQFNCIYSSGDNLVVTDNSSLAAIKTSEYEKGWYILHGFELIPVIDEDIQKSGFPSPAFNLIKPIENIELADTSVIPESFCKILEGIPGTWLNPELFLKIPSGEYDIGRFCESKKDINNRPVLFQNKTYTIVLMPIKH